ncbi:MAG: sodium:solute symporter family protein [Synergistaceae bacterium]|jgi:SSS family solute:Na+ symporter|nr:sodium:solute symporter family protein [Synergistaceae bacterium]
MSETIVSVSVVLVFTFITLGIGLFGWAKKLDKSAKDFFVASRTLGFIALFFTYTATYHSASAFLGTGGFLYRHGMSYWAMGPYTQALGGILLYIFGSRIWLLGKKFDMYSPGDLFEMYYQSKFLKMITGITVAAFVIPYIQLQLAGSGWLVEHVTRKEIGYFAGATITGIVVLIYVYLGGMRSVAWTDVFMGVFMFVAMVAGCWYLTDMLFGGATAAWGLVREKAPELLVLPGKANFFSIPMAFSWTVNITLASSVCAPYVILRMFSANSIKTLKWVGVLSPIYLIWIYISYVWFGLATGAAVPGIKFPDNNLPNALFDQASVFFAALVCAGGLAATLSTANSQLHAVGTLVARDCYCAVKKDASESSQVWVTRITVVAIFSLSLYFARKAPPLLSMLVSVATGGMAQLTPLLVGVLFWPRATKPGAICGFMTGLLLTCVLQFNLAAQLKPLSAFMTPGFWGLMANALVFVGVSLVTKPLPVEVIKSFHGYLASDEAQRLLKNG